MSTFQTSALAFGRIIFHTVTGVFVVMTALMTYYSLFPFIENSRDGGAPYSLALFCGLFPLLLISIYAFNTLLVTDKALPSFFKIVFMAVEALFLLVVMGLSSKNPIFGCHITECTYATLPRPLFIDETVQTWHPQSGEAVTALLYFWLSFFLLFPLGNQLLKQFSVFINFEGMAAAFSGGSKDEEIPAKSVHSSSMRRSMRRSIAAEDSIHDASASGAQIVARHTEVELNYDNYDNYDDEGAMEITQLSTVNPMAQQAQSLVLELQAKQSKRRASGGGGGRGFVQPGRRGSSRTAMTSEYRADDVSMEAAVAAGMWGGLNGEVSEAARQLLDWREYEKKLKISNQMRWLGLFLTLGLLFPIHLFSTTRFGNDFQWFSNYGMAAWAAHVIKPAIPQIILSEDVNYKFFPQIIIFYVFIYTVMVVAVAAKAFPSLKRFFEARPYNPQFKIFKDTFNSCTMGEFLFVSFYLFMTVATFAYTFFDWYGIPHEKWKGSHISERWGRCLGQTSLFPMGIMILPITRNSVWAKLLDYPWDQMIKFHKWMSVSFLLLSTSHMIAFWGVFGSLDIFPKAMLDSPNSYRDVDSTIAMMTGLTFAVIMPVFMILTYSAIRRTQFEWFYYTHFASMIIFMATLWHADFSWMYLIPGLTLYMIDHFLRFADVVVDYEVVALKPCGDDIVELKFGKKIRSKAKNAGGVDVNVVEKVPFESGQFCFITLSNVSAMQSHPFNFSGGMADPYNTVHIKSMGPQSWTGQLLTLAQNMKEVNEGDASNKGNKALVDLSKIKLSMDGPYGEAFPFQRTSSILLIGGGIGITPLHSVLRTLLYLCNSENIGLPQDCPLKKIRLVWAFRNDEVLSQNSTFMHTLLQIPAASLKKKTSSGQLKSYQKGKPKIGKEGKKGKDRKVSIAKERVSASSPSTAPQGQGRTQDEDGDEWGEENLAMRGSANRKGPKHSYRAGGDEPIVEDEEYDESQIDDGEDEGLDAFDSSLSLSELGTNPTTASILNGTVFEVSLYCTQGSHTGANADAGGGDAYYGKNSNNNSKKVAAAATDAEAAGNKYSLYYHWDDSAELDEDAVQPYGTVDSDNKSAKAFAFPHQVTPGRPDLAKEIQRMKGNPTALVFAVGPESLVTRARDLCSEHDVIFRGESSEL